MKTKKEKKQYSEEAIEESIKKTLARFADEEWQQLEEEVYASLSEEEWNTITGEELDRRIEKLKEQKKQDLATFDTAFDKPHDNDFLTLCNIGEHLISAIKEKDYDSILNVLDKLSLPKGFFLKVEEAQQHRLDNESNIFLEADGDTYDDSEIWDYIHVENSIHGAWQAYLLNRLRHILPLYGHALYDSRTYIYCSSGKDITVPEDIYSSYLGEEESKQLANLTNLEPDIVEFDGKYLISCCYLDYDHSLIREIVAVSISNDTASFNDIGQKYLIKRKRSIHC